MSLPAGATAVYNSSGSQYYRHADWLGSVRLVSTTSRTVSGDTAYAPFGYAYAQSGSPALSFTGHFQDTAANLYDFMSREYGIQGRWPSPDPLDTGAFNLADPQSLDLYAYVRNSPMMLTDPLGLRCVKLDNGMIGDDGTPPPCGDQTVSTTVTVSSEPDCYMPEMGGTGFLEQVPCWLVFMTGKDYTWGGIPGGMSVGWAGPGTPGGRAGPGGNTAGTPQTQGQSRAVCAANLADKYSIAGALGTTNKTGFWANVFNGVAGNTVSGFVLAVHPGLGNKYRAATSINNLTFQGTANAISAVTTPAPISELGLTSTVGSDLLGEGLGGIISVGKAVYDVGSFGVAYYECGK